MTSCAPAEQRKATTNTTENEKENKMRSRKLGSLEVSELGAGAMSISANYGPPTLDAKTDLRSGFERFTPENLAANMPIIELLGTFEKISVTKRVATWATLFLLRFSSLNLLLCSL